MTSLLFDEDQALRAAVHALFSDELFAHREGLDHTEKCRLTYDRMRYLNERLPPARALLKDPGHLLATLETAAVVSPSLFLAMTIHYCLSVNAVVEFGSGRDDLAPWLDELESMSSIGTLVVTEAGHGNSHAGIRTEARYSAGGFTLSTPEPEARKFMSNNGLAGVAKLGVVYARLVAGEQDHGAFPFLTRIRTADAVAPDVVVRPLPETPVLPLDYATVEFTGTRLPRECLLRDSATLSADGTLQDPLGDPALRLQRSLTVRQHAWIAAACGLAAVARAGTAIAVRHAYHRRTRSRHSAERPVVEFRPQQRSLFAALAATYASTCLVNRAKRAWTAAVTGGSPDTEPEWSPAAGLGRTLGMVKAAACWTAERVTTECGLRSGAHGMFSANRLIDYQGFAHMLNPAAGDSHLIALEVGRALAAGEHYRPPRRAKHDGVDPRSALGLLIARERILHTRLTAELSKAERRGQEPCEGWNNRLPLARELADAHANRLELACFVEAVDTCGRAALEPLLALHALELVARDAAWYLSEELLTPTQFQRFSRLRNGLTEALVPHALPLVEAFELPDVPAPLSRPDYVTAYDVIR